MVWISQSKLEMFILPQHKPPKHYLESKNHAWKYWQTCVLTLQIKKTHPHFPQSFTRCPTLVGRVSKGVRCSWATGESERPPCPKISSGSFSVRFHLENFWENPIPNFPEENPTGFKWKHSAQLKQGPKLKRGSFNNKNPKQVSRSYGLWCLDLQNVLT